MPRNSNWRKRGWSVGKPAKPVDYKIMKAPSKAAAVAKFKAQNSTQKVVATEKAGKNRHRLVVQDKR